MWASEIAYKRAVIWPNGSEDFNFIYIAQIWNELIFSTLFLSLMPRRSRAGAVPEAPPAAGGEMRVSLTGPRAVQLGRCPWSATEALTREGPTGQARADGTSAGTEPGVSSYSDL